MIRLAALLALLATPGAAITRPDDGPPQPSPTTFTCPPGTVWDHDEGSCVGPQDARLSDDDRYGAARELAYAGRYPEARAALDAMGEGDTSRVLTYRGFLARKAGDLAAAEHWYARALDADPGNLLARSYRGMGLLLSGDRMRAAAELQAIRDRGGRGTWAEQALATALDGGPVADY
jgi:Flp pilus assembly protein TadD